MKFRKGKYSVNFSISMLLIANISVFAAIKDNDRSIYITSNTQSLNMRTNIVTFVGNVTVTQGEIKIKADKIVISCPQKEYGKEILDGYGDPAIFYQAKDNCELVRGYASQIHYELEKKYMILSGNAYLNQRNSNISGDKITYLVKEKKIEAFSEKGKRVTSVLIPSYLQNHSKPNLK